MLKGTSFYIAEECTPININDNEVSIAYMGSEIEMKYDMEGGLKGISFTLLNCHY